MCHFFGTWKKLDHWKTVSRGDGARVFLRLWGLWRVLGDLELSLGEAELCPLQEDLSG